MTLVRRAADGDDDAFRELVRRVHPDLRRWALARTGDPDEVDEVVQRTLIAMHRALPGFAGKARLSTWLYRILANAASDVHRARTAGPERDREPELLAAAVSDPPDPIRTVHAERVAGTVWALIGGLPRRQREVMVLVDHEGRRPVDVAEMLGLKPVTVRASLFKARRAIREAVLARHPELMEGYEA
ncbi:MAG: sigma-70 family RNA polymerase sigma factor [Gemmatimonadetes bacterium]|nr:RNA polymerase sigma factor [Gemmatimonadota bacterium]NIQ55122.1 RNA polymerase sigma factor [Gemmatimonadota bacterium]NIX45101.1 sigma-70 family RNA polymerase sigma factor [Gemmatimonadota bacterium]NIY09354.1 sigma-70 family RNA polymerase sigma factor [Gemmatimonadota bacterium]